MPLSRDRLFSNNVKRYAVNQINHKLGLGFVTGPIIQHSRKIFFYTCQIIFHMTKKNSSRCIILFKRNGDSYIIILNISKTLLMNFSGKISLWSECVSCV